MSIDNININNKIILNENISLDLRKKISKAIFDFNLKKQDLKNLDYDEKKEILNLIEDSSEKFTLYKNEKKLIREFPVSIGEIKKITYKYDFKKNKILKEEKNKIYKI